MKKSNETVTFILQPCHPIGFTFFDVPRNSEIAIGLDWFPGHRKKDLYKLILIFLLIKKFILNYFILDLLISIVSSPIYYYQKSIRAGEIEWNGMICLDSCPYCLTADISWNSKKSPWPGVSKVLGYNPSIRIPQSWVICQLINWQII